MNEIIQEIIKYKEILEDRFRAHPTQGNAMAIDAIENLLYRLEKKNENT